MTDLMLGDASALPSSRMRDSIADPGLYRAVLRFVQARVPKGEAADIVQSTFADALGSETAPLVLGRAGAASGFRAAQDTRVDAAGGGRRQARGHRRRSALAARPGAATEKSGRLVTARLPRLAGPCVLVLASALLGSCSRRVDQPRAAAVGVPAISASSSPRHPVPPRRRRGGLDVTFLVASDAHFGSGVDDDAAPIDTSQPLGVERVHLAYIAEMNAIEGRRLPPGLGGRVSKPRGLLFAGDLTDAGTTTEWQRFAAFYGLTGSDALLRLPVFESVGNHDRIHFDLISREVIRRHGAERYSWDWDDLHVVCLGEGLIDGALDWLASDLAQAGTEVPIVIYLHFPLAGAFYLPEWDQPGGPYERLRQILAGHQIVGIFHGHHHASGAYRWHGYSVYKMGSAKHQWHAFGVVHVDDAHVEVLNWNVDRKAWWWWHRRPINGAPGPSVAGVAPPAGEPSRPEVALWR